nr:MAG: hypothetical protein [Porcellio scaber clopovirus]
MSSFLEKTGDKESKKIEMRKKRSSFSEEALLPRGLNRNNPACRQKDPSKIEKEACGSTASDLLRKKRFSYILLEDEHPPVVISTPKFKSAKMKQKKNISASLLNLAKDPSEIGMSYASRDCSPNGTFKNIPVPSSFSTFEESYKGICDFQERVLSRNASSIDLVRADISLKREKYPIPRDFEKYGNDVLKSDAGAAAAIFDPEKIIRDGFRESDFSFCDSFNNKKFIRESPLIPNLLSKAPLRRAPPPPPSVIRKVYGEPMFTSDQCPPLAVSTPKSKREKKKKKKKKNKNECDDDELFNLSMEEKSGISPFSFRDCSTRGSFKYKPTFPESQRQSFTFRNNYAEPYDFKRRDCSSNSNRSENPCSRMNDYLEGKSHVQENFNFLWDQGERSSADEEEKEEEEEEEDKTLTIYGHDDEVTWDDYEEPISESPLPPPLPLKRTKLFPRAPSPPPLIPPMIPPRFLKPSHSRNFKDGCDFSNESSVCVGGGVGGGTSSHRKYKQLINEDQREFASSRLSFMMNEDKKKKDKNVLKHLSNTFLAKLKIRRGNE